MGGFVEIGQSLVILPQRDVRDTSLVIGPGIAVISLQGFAEIAKGVLRAFLIGVEKATPAIRGTRIRSGFHPAITVFQGRRIRVRLQIQARRAIYADWLAGLSRSALTKSSAAVSRSPKSLCRAPRQK